MKHVNANSFSAVLEVSRKLYATSLASTPRSFGANLALKWSKCSMNRSQKHTPDAGFPACFVSGAERPGSFSSYRYTRSAC